MSDGRGSLYSETTKYFFQRFTVCVSLQRVVQLVGEERCLRLKGEWGVLHSTIGVL